MLYCLTIIFFLVSFVSCGKKKKDVFSFGKKTQKAKPGLRIASVHGGTAVRHGRNVVISWQEVTVLPRSVQTLHGYNIYRLRSWGIIPKSPLNKKPVKQTFFIDKKPPKNEQCYVVRPVIQEGTEYIAGPASKIIIINL